MRNILIAFLGIASMASAFVIAPGHARADTPVAKEDAPEGVISPLDAVQTFRNQNTGRCIDDTIEAGLRTFDCNGTGAQKWTVHVWNDGTVRFQSLQTGGCFYNGGFGFGSIACDDSQYESWYVKRWADNTVRFQNQATGQCMDDTDQGGFRTFACNSTPAQSWY